MSPIYEYFCAPCNKRFEVQVPKISDQQKREPCPICTERVGIVPATGSGFILKGDCWERDGYGSK